MWFFLVQTLGALAAAMGLGLLAGWLLFGGPGSASRARSRGGDATTTLDAPAAPGVLTELPAHEAPSVIGDISSFSDSALGSAAEGVSIIPSAPRPLVTAASTLADSVDSAESEPELSDANPVSSSNLWSVSEPANAVATASTSSDNDEFGTDSLIPRWEVEELESELEARTADVARLKLKLRKAVEEIEKRTAQTAAAREARDEERRRSAELADQLAVAHSQIAIAASGDQGRRVLELSNLEDLEAELERAKHRAGQLAVEVEELTRSNAHLQSTSESERQALTVEAASLRLRTEGALDQLNDFSREIASFHAEHAQHLARSQQLMGELQAKLAVARAALSGRPPTHVASSNQGATLVLPSVGVEPESNGLTQLSGMTPEIANQLSELGVGSIRDIAAWSVHDVQRMQEWLPEYPNIVADNRWVEQARSIVRSQRDSTARNLSGV